MAKPPLRPSDPSAGAEAEAGTRRLGLAGRALAIWSFLFMLPHLYWALGGRAGLAAVHPAAPELPQWQGLNWIAVAPLLAVGLLSLMLVPLSRRRFVRATMMVFAWAGCSLAVAHAFYGIGDRLLTIVGRTLAPSPSEGIETFILVDLLVFEPWFLVEGMLLGLIGWLLLTDSAHRRFWLAACGAGIALALTTALFNLRIG